MNTICAWCHPGVLGPDVSHGICQECITKHFPELADEPAIHFPGRVVGNPAEAPLPASCDAEAGCFSGPARSLFARSIGLSADGDGIEGILDGPRRSLFSPRNRFRPGVLGNMLIETGALRRVA
jgi:hypothetical protein